MLLYHLFWMIMCFILHFYIIFGTNLLTGGPAQIAVFLPISVFRRKGISNKVQTEWNLRECYFWNKRDPGDLEWTSRNNQGGHEPGGAPTPWARPPASWAPRCSTDLLLPPIYIHIPREHPGALRNPISTTATFCTQENPSWGLFRSSAWGGIDHGGPLHQLHGPSNDVWVVYLRPSGP